MKNSNIQQNVEISFVCNGEVDQTFAVSNAIYLSVSPSSPLFASKMYIGTEWSLEKIACN